MSGLSLLTELISLSIDLVAKRMTSIYGPSHCGDVLSVRERNAHEQTAQGKGNARKQEVRGVGTRAKPDPGRGKSFTCALNWSFGEPRAIDIVGD
jgi:hypothetical protein